MVPTQSVTVIELREKLTLLLDAYMDVGSRAMQELLPTTARMQEVEQCRSYCRESWDDDYIHAGIHEGEGTVHP
ncbi:MAG: hypothetical protein ACXWT1_14180 [Methylobacter sp.]